MNRAGAESAENRLTQHFVVGIVGSPHGISGEVKIESTSGEKSHFAQMKEVALRKNRDSECRSFKVERVEVGGRDLYMKICGIDSPEEAKKYAKWEIVVPRKNAQPLGKDEWYIEDLKGCSLTFAGDGKVGQSVVGTVAGVMEGGNGDLLEVVLAEECDILADSVKYSIKKDGSKEIRTVYIPFSKESGFIGNVDVKSGKIELMHLWILE